MAGFHPATLWATDGGGLAPKDGSDLEHAAAIDPNDADDIWTIINGYDPDVDGTTIKLCADSPVTIGATINVDRAGAFSKLFYLLGRNAADTADSAVTIDANGGAFTIFTLTAPHWQFRRISGTNTDGLDSHNAWTGATGADYCRWFNCKGTFCYNGWDLSAASTSHLMGCEASDNEYRGFRQSFGTTCWGCVANGNGNDGFHDGLAVLASIASNNGGIGIDCVRNVVAGCVAYGNVSGICEDLRHTVIADCIMAGNSAYGAICTDRWSHLINCAFHDNTSGEIYGSDYTAENKITLTADPFTDAANRDFSLNDAPGGGALCRGLLHPGADGNWTSYLDIGAVQHRGAGAAVIGSSVIVPGRGMM